MASRQFFFLVKTSRQFSFQKSMASGSRRMPKPTHNCTTEFGDPVIVKPTGKHQATIVWLHDLNEFAPQASEFVKSFSFCNVKWICACAPTIAHMGFGGVPTKAWFKVTEFSSAFPDPYEIEGLKNAAAHVAGLLKDEPETVMKGVAGYGIGGALALHIATCYALGSFPIQLRAVVGINCWLPHQFGLEAKMKTIHGAISRAAEFPILVTHNYNDNLVPYETGSLSVRELRKSGFQVKQTKIHKNDHAIVFQVMTEVSLWLTKKLGLEGEQDPTE